MLVCHFFCPERLFGSFDGQESEGDPEMGATQNEKPDPQRVAILRSLPLEVKEQITGEEADAFMYNRELPESLLEKLKEYLVEDES
jgi:hypothetical protein